MNSRGFLKRRKHDTKKASAPPPSTSTASRYEEEEAQVHGYSWEDLQRLWPHEGSSGTCLIRHLTMPTPPNPILPHLSLSLPSFPRQHRVHRISHTSSCVITGTPQAGSDLSGRFSHVFERNCCKPWNEPVKSTFKKMCKLRFPFRSASRILQKGRRKIQAWKKGLKAVGVSDDVMIRF